MDERQYEDLSALIRAASERLEANAPFRLKVLVQMLLVELHRVRLAKTVSTDSRGGDRA